MARTLPPSPLNTLTRALFDVRCIDCSPYHGLNRYALHQYKPSTVTSRDPKKPMARDNQLPKHQLHALRTSISVQFVEQHSTVTKMTP